MEIIRNYDHVLRQYCVFKGRARRREYWFFVLVSAIITLILMGIDKSVGLYDAKLGMGVLGFIYGLLIALPGLGVTVRRFHDINRSGFWFFIILVPLVGWLISIIMLARKGHSGENQYGSDPKQLTSIG